MRITRLRYLQQKSHLELNFKAILLTFITAIFLSACGIKSDLYETPEQAVVEKDTVVEQSKESRGKSASTSVARQENSVIKGDESKKQQVVQQPIEQTATPSVKQSTDQVKE